MKLTVTGLMFLVLLEFTYCAPPYAQLPQERPRVDYTRTGAMYDPYSPGFSQDPNGGVQWTQQNWQNRQPYYMNQNQDRTQTSKRAGPNLGGGLNLFKGLLDVNARASLNDEYSNANEHYSNTNVFQPERTFYDPFGK